MMQITHTTKQVSSAEGSKSPSSAEAAPNAIDIDAIRTSITEQLDDAVDHFIDIMTVPDYFAATLKDYVEGLGPFLLVESNNYTKRKSLPKRVELVAIANARLLCDTYRPVYHLAIARHLIDDIDYCMTDTEREGLSKALSTEAQQLFRELEYIFGLMRRALIHHLNKAIPCMTAMQECYTNVPREGTELDVWDILHASISETTTGKHKRLDMLVRGLCDKSNNSIEASNSIILDLMDFYQDDMTGKPMLSQSVTRVISSLARVNSLQMQLTAFRLYQENWDTSETAQRMTMVKMASVAGANARLDTNVYHYCRAFRLSLDANDHLQHDLPNRGKQNQHATLEILTGDLPVMLKHVDSGSVGSAKLELPPGPRPLGVEGMDLYAIFKDLVTYTHDTSETLPAPSTAAKASRVETSMPPTSSQHGSKRIKTTSGAVHLREPAPLLGPSAPPVSQQQKQPRSGASKLGARSAPPSEESFGEHRQGSSFTPNEPYRYDVPSKAKKSKTRGVARPPTANEQQILQQEEPEQEPQVIELDHDDYVVFQWMMNFSSVPLRAFYEWDVVLKALAAAGFVGERRDNGVWIFHRADMRGVTAHEPHQLWSRREGQAFGRRIERLGFNKDMLRERA